MAGLPERARRAGVSVTLTARPEATGPYDLVLVDAPCSGSGSWRRDPEAKWGLTPDRLDALVAEQASILARASAMVAEGGHLAYVTCSLFRRENLGQVSSFLACHAGWTLKTHQTLTPLSSGDGFFLAILRRA
jgi:16S rRNA (cytosine967-C5)-methyltransferase